MDLFGGAKNTTKSKKTKKTSETKKTTKSEKASDAKKSKKSTTARSKAKGGNFLGAVGDLVAPTGWGPFATAAGLFALDRADAALRRGTKEKKEKMKGGKKMKGGLCQESAKGKIKQISIGKENSETKGLWTHINMKSKEYNDYEKLKIDYQWSNDDRQFITIECNKNEKYYFKVTLFCNNKIIIYEHLPKNNNKKNFLTDLKYFYQTFDEAEKIARKPEVQKSLVNLALFNECEKISNS